MLVMKFGGTSVGGFEKLERVASLVSEVKDDRIVVLSAMSGVTNYLYEIADKIEQGADVPESILPLIEKFKQTIFALNIGKEEKDTLWLNVESRIQSINQWVDEPNKKQVRQKIITFGETLSCMMMVGILIHRGESVRYIPATNFMRLDSNNEPDYFYIQERIQDEIAKEDSAIIITEGFVCKTYDGQIGNLERGGSDYTASIIGRCVMATEVQIWTDIDGMHNNDPRFVEKTFPIDHLSFEEAAELAYFGAKVLHPTCILPVQLVNVPVRIKNTSDPDAKGTLISHKTQGKGIKAVAARDGIHILKIKSFRMLMAYGFLEKVFSIFNKHQMPIDVITTSEVSISVTIDRLDNIDELMEDLSDLGEVSLTSGHSLVCVVGDFIADSVGHASKIFSSLKNVPLRMISYGSSDHNVTLLIDTVNKKEALNALNIVCFEEASLIC